MLAKECTRLRRNMSNINRRFTDKEVQAIIKDALALQRRGTVAPQENPREGLSMTDLESIGNDVGISSEFIRQAIADMGQASENSFMSRFLGGTLQPEEETGLTGIVSEDHLKRILPMIPSVTRDDGNGDVLGSSLTWSTSAESTVNTGRRTDIIISSTRANTTIHVTDHLGGIAGGVFGGIAGGVGLGVGFGVGFGVGIAALGSILFAIFFPVGVIGACYLLSRSIYSTVLRIRKNRLKEIIQKLKGVLRSQQTKDTNEGETP